MNWKPDAGGWQRDPTSVPCPQSSPGPVVEAVACPAMQALARQVGGSPRAGFTIIELVLTIVLLGAVLAIAAPRLNLAQTRINAATQQASLTMLSAHRMAIQQQHNVVVAIDTVGRILRVHSDRDNDGVIDSDEMVRQVELEKGVRFGLGGATARLIGSAPVTFTRTQGGLPAVTFNRGGTASEFGGFYLSSVSTGADGDRPTDTRAFEVERAIGRFERYFFANGAWTREW